MDPRYGNRYVRERRRAPRVIGRNRQRADLPAPRVPPELGNPPELDFPNLPPDAPNFENLPPVAPNFENPPVPLNPPPVNHELPQNVNAPPLPFNFQQLLQEPDWYFGVIPELDLNLALPGSPEPMNLPPVFHEPVENVPDIPYIPEPVPAPEPMNFPFLGPYYAPIDIDPLAMLPPMPAAGMEGNGNNDVVAGDDAGSIHSSVGSNNPVMEVLPDQAAEENPPEDFLTEIEERLLSVADVEFQLAYLERGNMRSRYHQYIKRLKRLYGDRMINGLNYPDDQWKSVLLYFIPRTPDMVRRLNRARARDRAYYYEFREFARYISTSILRHL